MDVEYDDVGLAYNYYFFFTAACIVLPISYFKLRKKRRTWSDIIVVLVGLSILGLFAYNISQLQGEELYDPFEVLSISHSASDREIKKRYRELSRVWHPDKNDAPEAEEMFVRISKAYKALTDPETRKNWEEYGNPDGPQEKKFGVALPAWIAQKENSVVVIYIYILGIMIILPLFVWMRWRKGKQFTTGAVHQHDRAFFFQLFMAGSRTVSDILRVITSAQEFQEKSGPLVGVDLKSVQELAVSCIDIDLDSAPQKKKGKKGPASHVANLTARIEGGLAKRVRILIYAHLNRLQIPDNLVPGFEYAFELFPRLIQAALEVTVNPYTSLAKQAFSLMELNQRLVQALTPDQSELLQVPHFTENTVKALKGMSIQKMSDLLPLDNDDLKDKVGRAVDGDDDVLEDIVEYLADFPMTFVTLAARVHPYMLVEDKSVQKDAEEEQVFGDDWSDDEGDDEDGDGKKKKAAKQKTAREIAEAKERERKVKAKQASRYFVALVLMFEAKIVRLDDEQRQEIKAARKKERIAKQEKRSAMKKGKGGKSKKSKASKKVEKAEESKKSDTKTEEKSKKDSENGGDEDAKEDDGKDGKKGKKNGNDDDIDDDEEDASESSESEDEEDEDEDDGDEELTPLLHAIADNENDELEALIEQEGADTATKKNMWTPLHFAAAANNVEAAEILIEKGASVDALDKNLNTPLHIAATENGPGVVQCLLDNAANKQAENKKMRTPLHLAAKYGLEDVVDILLANDVAVAVLDEDNRSALDLAEKVSKKEDSMRRAAKRRIAAKLSDLSRSEEWDMLDEQSAAKGGKTNKGPVKSHLVNAPFYPIGPPKQEWWWVIITDSSDKNVFACERVLNLKHAQKVALRSDVRVDKVPNMKRGGVVKFNLHVVSDSYIGAQTTVPFEVNIGKVPTAKQLLKAREKAEEAKKAAEEQKANAPEAVTDAGAADVAQNLDEYEEDSDSASDGEDGSGSDAEEF